MVILFSYTRMPLFFPGQIIDQCRQRAGYFMQPLIIFLFYKRMAHGFLFKIEYTKS